MHQPYRVLVVASPTVSLVWNEELDKHMTPEFLLHVHRASANVPRVREATRDLTHPLHVVVTSYDLLSPCLLSAFPADVCVFDECHALKNPCSVRHAAAARVPRHILMIGLSGTPNSNNPEGDLHALCELIVGFVPQSDEMATFVIRSRACDPEVSVHLRLPRLVEEEVCEKFESRYEVEVYDEHHRKAQRLAGMLASCHESDTRLLRAYQSSIHLLGLVTNHPQLHAFGKGKSKGKGKDRGKCKGKIAVKSAFVSTKLRLLLDQLRVTPPQTSPIVTTRSLQMLRLVEHHICHTLPMWKCLVFTGEQSTRAREKVLNEWRRDAPQGRCILLLSMLAGSQGLTLTESNTMYILDARSHPNPQHEQQVIHRIFRRGQSSPCVRVVHLSIRDTLDCALLSLHVDKRTRVENLIRGGPAKTTPLASVMALAREQWPPSCVKWIRHSKWSACEKVRTCVNSKSPHPAPYLEVGGTKCRTLFPSDPAMYVLCLHHGKYAISCKLRTAVRSGRISSTTTSMLGYLRRDRARRKVIDAVVEDAMEMLRQGASVHVCCHSGKHLSQTVAMCIKMRTIEIGIPVRYRVRSSTRIPHDCLFYSSKA